MNIYFGWVMRCINTYLNVFPTKKPPAFPLAGFFFLNVIFSNQ
ncbi:hypothetical protein AB50_0851 [Escherichia coli 6-175-07_S1_C2]|nr:hypothetical protein AB50_0851 [Escherichia coli 6-175-07_S1_C2]